MKIRTNAKINLFLGVLERRPDGFHEIETILHNVGFGDEMEISVGAGTGVEVVMILEDGLLGPAPAPRDNLIHRAAERVLELSGSTAGVRIVTRKRVPMGGGLGGGSANAAGTLVALNELLAAGLSTHELEGVAAELGSDVPFCLTGGTAMGTSRGERVRALPSRSGAWFVLGLSDRPVQTREVYGRWRPSGAPTPASPARMAHAIEGGEPSEIASLLHNDLEPCIFEMRPDVRAGVTRMTAAGALGSLTSGSGPTVFGVASDEGHARSIAEGVSGDFDRVRVVGSRPGCVERLV